MFCSLKKKDREVYFGEIKIKDADMSSIKSEKKQNTFTKNSRFSLYS